MTPRFLQRTTILLLLVYAPLVLSVGILHTDEVCGQCHGSELVQHATLHGTGQSSDAGFCFACLLASGHLLQSVPPIPHHSIVSKVVTPTVELIPQNSPERAIARGPPSAFFS
jgi:hypothetical protein